MHLKSFIETVGTEQYSFIVIYTTINQYKWNFMETSDENEFIKDVIISEMEIFSTSLYECAASALWWLMKFCSLRVPPTA